MILEAASAIKRLTAANSDAADVRRDGGRILRIEPV